jgi:hypothetical protein
MLGKLTGAAVAQEVEARVTSTLAQDYPAAQLFMMAAVHAGVDYFIVNRTVPQSLQQCIDSGFLPYSLPSNPGWYWQADERMVSCWSPHDPIYRMGVFTPQRKVSFGYPAPGLTFSIPAQSFGDGIAVPATRGYNFYAARYLEAGLSLEQLAPVQRRIRVGEHLAALVREYAAQHDRLPASLADAESFQGLLRNPAAWQDCLIVNHLSQVSARPGAIFYGSSEEGGVSLIVNHGPGTDRFDFRRNTPGADQRLWSIGRAIWY